MLARFFYVANNFDNTKLKRLRAHYLEVTFVINAPLMSPEVKSVPFNSLSVSLDQTRLASLIDSIPALVASIDCNMILQLGNRPFKDWFCLSGNVSGKAFPLVVGKQVFDQVQRHLGKVLVGDRAQFQISMSTEKGTQFLDATLSPEFDGRQRVVGFIFHCSDVTEKNRTERALKDYFENASIALHWVNADGIIIWANPAELRMLGYTEEEYIGRHISEFHAKKAAIDDILDRLAHKQTLHNYEADLRCKDESIRHVAINSTVLWEGDKFIHTRCFTMDVTEQKRASEAVKESEERFRMMANLVPLIIWTTDENGACNFLNVKWVEITGTSVEEGFGDQWQKFIHPDDRENISSSWKQSFKKKKPFEAKFRILNPKGNFIVSYLNSNPRFNTSGEFLGYIGIIQDVTEQEIIRSSLEKIVLERTEDLRKRNADLKLAEERLIRKNLELEAINNELSSFAHVASHDLQEPLRKIQTFSNRLIELEGNKISDKGREFYDRIQTSAERMRALIQDLLTFSKSSDTKANSEYIDLNLLFNEVISELELKVDEKNAQIENLGLPVLNVIRFQFHQLFLNLISNALKFSKPGMRPHVVIKSEKIKGSLVNDLVEAGEEYYHISVSDNGIGFERQFSEKIFEIFHRLNGKVPYEGTGIGLAICKKIIQNHKGVIVAEGALNQGATFHVYIPA